MSDELRVNPETLSQAGNEIAGHGERLYALHQSCHRDAEDAHPGWVGSSAEALPGLLDNWATSSTGHLNRIARQSCEMHLAAAEFRVADQRNATALDGH